MITRQATATLLELAKGYPVLAITGPRQAGKTTLAQSTFPDKRYVSLEDPDTRAFAQDDPRGFLARLPDGAILDEVQRCLPLFSYLQTRVDANRRMAEFVLTGSQQFGLLSTITQTLAGRVGLVQLLPFSLQELGSGPLTVPSLDELLWRGLYPPIHDRQLAPERWFANYVMTYVERDVRQLIEVQNLSLFQRFLKMCAARCGQLLNMTSLANDCGVTHKTIGAWLSVLEAGYVIFLLQPHHKNFGKRLVKTPKLYFLDTGLCAWLLGITSERDMQSHYARGALFETWAVTEALKWRAVRGNAQPLYFWRDNIGNEVDLLLEQDAGITLVEVKSGQTFQADWLKSLKTVQRHMSQPTRNAVLYGGDLSTGRTDAELVGWRDLVLAG